jgi:hypothetical protein
MDAARPRLRRPAALLLLGCLALVALPLSACGDDSGSDDATSAADAGLRVEVTPEAVDPGGKVKARVVNDTAERFTYGLGYELERQQGESFEPVKLPRRAVPAIGLIAAPGETGPPVTVRIPADALPGQYRVVIQRDVPDVGDLSGEFEVRDDG